MSLSLALTRIPLINFSTTTQGETAHQHVNLADQVCWRSPGGRTSPKEHTENVRDPSTFGFHESARPKSPAMAALLQGSLVPYQRKIRKCSFIWQWGSSKRHGPGKTNNLRFQRSSRKYVTTQALNVSPHLPAVVF